MSTFAQDSTGDIVLTLGEVTLLQGDQAIAQNLFNRLRLFVGEWFLDQRVGIPYFDVVFVKNPDLNVIGQFFRSIILGTPGVANVLSVTPSFNAATRKATVSFTATTTDGVIITADSLDKPFIVGKPVTQ